MAQRRGSRIMREPLFRPEEKCGLKNIKNMLMDMLT